MENTQRNRDHYSGAAWLSYDLNCMPEVQRKAFLFDLVASAKSGNAKLRNILIDPRLLAADRDDPVGKLYPDSANHSVPNIAKLVHHYCKHRWGKSLRQLLDPASLILITPEDISADDTAASEAPLPEYVKRDSKAFLAHIRGMRNDELAQRAWHQAMKTGPAVSDDIPIAA